MSKTLILVRHAKSDWENAKLSDFDRPLNTRGEKNAPEMAKRLLKQKHVPHQIVSSPAVRAITTARAFAKIFGIDRSLIVEQPQIYEATSGTLLAVVNNFDDRHNCTALFGHNPGITQLAESLCGKDFNNIPTCGVVIMTFPFDSWKMISSGTGQLDLYDYPKSDQE